MAYPKQNFSDGNVLFAAQLNAMDDQIAKNENDIKLSNEHIMSGDIDDAILHLGLYVDEDGDICQLEEE